MLTLTGIRIYPVKSLAGIVRSRATVLPKGLEYDRRWMLVDENGVFLTQRVHGMMALFDVLESPQGFVISHQGDSLTLPYDQGKASNPFEVQIWDDRVVAFEVNPEFSSWFSSKLDFRCRLVAFPESNPRQIDTAFATEGENVSLADAYPLMIIGESSLADLNARLSEPMTMNRFRPNLIFSGGAPYEEDTWNEFSIAGRQFNGVKRCARCVLTTINPRTGEKGAEPLKTLATYRRGNNKIYFGQNVIARTQDEIQVGDTIQVNSNHQAVANLSNNAHYDSALS
ncbi:MAG TPA: MOSC N-terminal beta barrel domain-containing protein [Chryseolinea sp.]|nr:MOSC N-terminal beta barrel domain-containing protein [Chryseolinea sp.]